jgi:hypothetical protein
MTVNKDRVSNPQLLVLCIELFYLFDSGSLSNSCIKGHNFLLLELERQRGLVQSQPLNLFKDVNLGFESSGLFESVLSTLLIRDDVVEVDLLAETFQVLTNKDLLIVLFFSLH